jgi:hypothetical protein
MTMESLPPEKSKRGLLKLRGGFAQDVDGLGFEELKMRDG